MTPQACDIVRELLRMDPLLCGVGFFSMAICFLALVILAGRKPPG